MAGNVIAAPVSRAEDSRIEPAHIGGFDDESASGFEHLCTEPDNPLRFTKMLDDLVQDDDVDP